MTKKISSKEITNSFQKNRRQNEVDSNRRTQGVGVGKSTIASILFHPDKGFEVGVDATGFTKTFNEKDHPRLHYTVIDTPALVGEKNRENLGLQRNGRCKVIFIATATELGDLRPEDSTTLSLIAKVMKEISSEHKFAIIINKATPSIQERWENDQEGLMGCKINTIPHIHEIDSISDPEIGVITDQLSKIHKGYLGLIKRDLENTISNCPTVSLTTAKVEFSEVTDESKEKEPANQDNSKKPRKPPNHPGIERFPQKKVKKEKNNQLSEVADQESDSNEEVKSEVNSQDSEDSPKNASKGRDSKSSNQKKGTFEKRGDRISLFQNQSPKSKSSSSYRQNNFQQEESEEDRKNKKKYHTNNPKDRKKKKKEEKEDSEEERKNRNRTIPQQSSISSSNTIPKEELESMQVDLLEMPSCAEKSLVQILAFLNDGVSLNSQEFQRELSELENQLAIEKFGEKVLNKYSVFRNQLERRALEAAKDELTLILRLVRPLHINEVVILTKKATEAGKILKGKKVLLFIGATGAGKSTTIHYLCGSRFIGTMLNGLPHLAPTNVKNPELINVTTNPQAKSETRYITAVAIDDEYVLCDTPGFEDTDGAEVDIANGVGVIQAIRQCKEVKPILLISYKGLGDRGEGLKKLARTLTMMLPGFKDNMKPMGYFLTKFPDDEELRGSLKAFLEDVKSHLTMEDKADLAFVRFFDDMIQKSGKKDLPDIKFIDLLKENEAGDILLGLKDGQFIEYPADKFRTYITQDSRAVLDKQLAAHKAYISEALKRRDYKYVDFRLSELNSLYAAIGDDNINQLYKEAVAQIVEQFNKEYTLTIKTLERQFSPQNELTIEDIQSLIKVIESLEIAKSLRKNHLKEEAAVVQAGTYYQFLTKQTSKLADNFIKEFSDLSKDFRHFQTILAKIELIACACKNKDLANEFQRVLNFINSKIEVNQKLCDENFTNKAYDVVAAQLIELHQLSELASPYLKSFNYQNVLDQLVTALKNETSKRIKLPDTSYLLKGRDEKEKLTAIADWSEKLSLAEQSFNHPEHHPCSEIKEISEEFFSQIFLCAQSLGNEIQSQFSQEIPEDIFAKLEKPFRVIVELKDIPKISAKLQSTYWSTLDTLTSRLKDSKRTAQDIIKNIYHSSRREDGEDLKKYLENLDTAKWIDEFATPKVCENVSSEIKEKIRSYAESIGKTLSKVESDSDSYNWLNEVSSTLLKMKILEPLKSEIDNLGDVFENISGQVQKMSSQILRDIEEEFCKDKLEKMRPGLLDAQKAEDAVMALKAIQEWDESSEYRNARAVLIGYLSEYSMKVRQYFTELLQLKDSLNTDTGKISEDSISFDGDSVDQSPSKFKSLEVNLHQLKDRAKNMTKYIKELKLIEKHPNLKRSYFKEDLVKEFLHEVYLLRDELVMEVADLLTQKNSITQLKIKVQIIQNLKGLDEVIDGVSFIQIYKEILPKFQEILGEQEIEAINDIKTADIESLESGVEKLREIEHISPQLIPRMKRVIARHITDLILDIEGKFGDLRLKNSSTREMKQISEVLSSLERAKDCIPKDYISPALKKKVDECLASAKNDIATKIENYVQALEGFAKCNNYSAVSERLDFIERVINFFKFCLIKEKSEPLEAKILEYRKNGAQRLIQDYKKRDLTEYALFPPKNLFDPSGQDVTGDQYELNQVILEKCRGELELAAVGTLDSANPGFTKVEDALQYLPENLQIIVKNELENRRRQVKTQSDNFEMQFTGREKVEASHIHKIYVDSEKSGVKEATQRTMKFVIQQFETLKMDLERNLESWEGENAILLLKDLLEYKSYFASNAEFCRQTTGINGSILRTLESRFNNLFTALSKAFSTEADVDSPEMLLKKVEYLIVFREFRVHSKDKRISNEMMEEEETSGKSMELAELWLPKDFDVKCDDLFRIISKFLEQKIKIFKDLFNTHDTLSEETISYLPNTIESLQRWDYFFAYLHNKRHSVTVQALVNILDLPTSAEVTRKLTELIHETKRSILNASSMNSEIVLLEKERDRAFIQINSSLRFLQNAAKIRVRFDFNPESIYKECSDALRERFIQINQKASAHLKKFLDAPHNSSKDEADKFNQCYQLLHCFQKQIKTQSELPKIEDFESPILAKVRGYDIESFVKAGDPQKLAEGLKKVKLISNMIPPFKEKIDKFLDGVFDGIRMTTHGSNIISNIGSLLNNDVVGQSIVSEHKAFEGYSLSIFNQKIRTQGIDYVFNNIRCDDKIARESLEARYKRYKEKYEQLVKDHIGATVDFGQIVFQLNILIGSGVSINEMGGVEWDQSNSDKISEILAFICAIWTLLNASYYLEAPDSIDKKLYLFQPHPAQVISIFRIFSVGEESSALRNNLVQIGTGEGKSLILAATSAIFALHGFEVSCACYSEYLSRRDCMAFQKLFNILNISSSIQYGTFNKLCENVINQDGDIRQIVETMVSNGPKSDNQKKSNRPKILLIDEVDVFFKKDFFGNTYTPSASLKDNTVTKLVMYIWNNRNSSLSFESVTKSQEFQDCCERYKGWEDLIKETVKDMISEVKLFESHDYIVQNDKIGYKEQDGISFNVSYGYQTLFAYFKEFNNKAISQESRDENICISLKCGHFSYAEMPKGFSFIMGVTGTLETLSPIERKMIAETYKISKFTYTPSVFGKNNLKFSKSEDILIEPESDYFNTIVREINNRLIGKSGSRAVLVVFESEEKLIEFRDSSAFSSLKGFSRYLTEKANMQEKEYFVKQATISGQVSLLTRSFGRGTDFVCLDPIVEANGGVHVIQTFLSEEISEEVQIRGRTARQGNLGSYGMVLLDQSLEKFMITREQVDAMIARSGSFWEWLKGKSKTIYDHLNESRYEIYKTKYDDSSRFVVEAAKSHDEGLKFIKNLHDNNAEFVKEFLLKLNKGAAEISSTSSRTICLMDATGSMTHLLHKAKTTVGIMFERGLEIMRKNGVANDFQMQFVVYRNYDCTEDKLLQVSTWESQPENLKAFMERILPEGGYGAHEAVEIGLSHAYQEAQKNKISQIILIGDAPPNTIDEVKEKRDYRKKIYWDTTKFNVPTHWKEQVQNLSGIPIHAFYVIPDAEDAFTKIANMSGGQCKYLNVNSAEGATMLTDCVTETILKNVGELTGKGDQLVNEYRKKYSKAFSKSADIF